MKRKLLLLFALALMGGATAMATTLSDLTATNVNATYSIAGDFYTQDTPNTTDGGGWTVTYTGSGWGNAANNNLWFWACSAVNISKTVELPAGTYIMHTTLPLLNGGRCAFAAFAGSTATFSSSDGYADASALGRTSADATQSNVNLYVPFYVSTQGNVTMAYNVIWGSKEFQISQFTLYAVKEDETAGDYTSLLATTAQMESVIAGMSEAKQTLKVKLAEANALYTETENKVGTALFQYKTANRTALKTAIDAAQAVFDNLSSTDDDFTTQTAALTAAINTMSTEINAPDASKYYFISQQDGSSVDWYLNASATAGTLQPYVSTLPYVMQFEATGTGTQFYLKTASGKYITTNNNAWAAIINETAEAWTVAPNDDGSVSFVSTAQKATLSPWGLTMEWNVGLTTSYANWTVSEASEFFSN